MILLSLLSVNQSNGTGHALEHAMKPIGFRSETSTTVIGDFATKELFVE